MNNTLIPITTSNMELLKYSTDSSTLKRDSQESTDGHFATDLSTKLIKAEDGILTAHTPPRDSNLTIDIIKTQKSKNQKSGNKKSFVWKYFSHPKNVDGIEDRSRTECLECKSQLAFNASGTTTTMLNHLKSRHPKIAESEEWRKMKLNSGNLGSYENAFTTPINNESPTETLSPSASFDFHKPSNSSPDCRNSEVNVLSLFPNNQENKYLHDQGRLVCLTKLIPHKLMVTSCLSTPNMDSSILTTASNGHTTMVQGEVNGNINNINGCVNTNSYYAANRSAVKRKRKKPICMQNTNQLIMNGGSNQLYNIKSAKLDKIVKHDPPDLASIQSISAISHNSASINKILNHNFLTDTLYNDNNNNNSSSPLFMSLKSFSNFNIPSSPSSPLAYKTGITESDRVIVYWLIKDLRPFSVLEEYGMKTLFSSLMPSVIIPSVSTLKNQIMPSIYYSLKTEILNDFSAECGAAFSIELWDIPTNGNMYASVKLHYYSNEDSQLRNKMFTTKEINVKCLCSDLLLSSCNEIGVDFSKLQFLPVVMNNPESMRDELANVGEIEQNKKFIIIPCLMSSLQEVAKVGFQEPEIIKLLDKCRALKELAGAYNLQLDNGCTIGSNTFITSKYSSEKFELIYWVYLNLDQIIDKLDCFNSNRFSKDDEIFLKQLTPLLEHIYQTLNVIEQNKLFFSASMIKSIILTMNKSPFQPKDDDHHGVIQFKIAVKNRLSKIYPSTGKLHEILWIATLLDPRFKKYQDPDESVMLEELRNQIINTNDLSTQFSQDLPNTIKREDLHSIFGDDCFSQEPKSEVDQYLNEHKIDIEKNPIKWWQDNSSRFPNLSKLALKYLCIPLANQYGLDSAENDSIIYTRRKDINPEDIDHYLFLNHNWR